MSLRERLGNGISTALNRYVALDPEARRKLRRLEGRSVTVELSGPEIHFSLAVENGRFCMGPADAEADARIRATPGAFAALAGSRGQIAAGQVELAGDTEAAQRFQRFFADLDPDFEEAVTDIFGDVIGFRISQLVGGGVRWARHASRRFAEDVSEYLREESRQLVTEPEVEGFLDDVDSIRDDVERLAARVRRLKDRRGG